MGWPSRSRPRRTREAEGLQEGRSLGRGSPRASETQKAAGEDSTGSIGQPQALTFFPRAVVHLAFSAFVKPDFSGLSRKLKVKTEKAWGGHFQESWQ